MEDIQLARKGIENCDEKMLSTQPFTTSWYQKPSEDAELARLIQTVFAQQRRSLPSLHRGWQTPDPMPTWEVACAEEYDDFVQDMSVANFMCQTEDTATTATTDDACSLRCRTVSSLSEQSPRQGSPEDWLRIRTPSPEMRETVAFRCLPCLPLSEQSQSPPGAFSANSDAGCPRPPGDFSPPVDAPADANERPQICQIIPSRGSRGHPYTCQEACKYNKKTRGCKDGADCDRCHLCEWTRLRTKKDTEQEMVGGDSVSSLWASQGSVGHPHACKEACKHMKKKNFCAFGKACRYCHLCAGMPSVPQ